MAPEEIGIVIAGLRFIIKAGKFVESVEPWLGVQPPFSDQTGAVAGLLEARRQGGLAGRRGAVTVLVTHRFSTVSAADLIIVRDDLRVAATAIELARRTLKTIRGNLAWAFGYNVAAIPLAACGLLNPLIAGAAMAFSSAFVVWNSARIRHFADPDLSGAVGTVSGPKADELRMTA